MTCECLASRSCVKTPRLPLLLLMLFLLLGLPVAPAGGGLESDESDAFRLDETFACESRNPDVAALPDGGFAAVWVSENQRVVLRRFDGELEAVGPETVVTDGPPPADGAIGDVGVAADPDGGLAVVWFDNRAGLQGRLFDATGAPLTEVLLFEAAGLDPELDVAALPDGSFAVVSRRASSLQALHFDGSGREIGRFEVTSATPGSVTVRQPSVAVLRNDRLVIAWNRRMTGFPFPFSRVEQQVFDLEGDPSGGLEVGVDGEGPSVAAHPAGGFVRVWRRAGEILVRRFDGLGNPSTPEIQVGLDEEGLGAAPDLAVLPDGTVRVMWEGNPPPLPGSGAVPPPSRRVLLRRFTPEGEPRGPVQTLGFGPEAFRSDGPPRAVTLGGGDTLVVARHLLQPILADPVPCRLVAGIFARRLPGASLVVSDRFRVSVEWHDAASGDRGVGRPGPRTDDTGSFWFFEPDNLELIVKVVDGRRVNEHFWFFYGALTNVGYRITVTDLVTGDERRYDNPPGRLASFADTRAFQPPIPPPETAPATGSGFGDGTAVGSEATAPPEGVLFLPAEPPAQIDSSAGPCSPLELPIPPRPGLCFADRRFEVEVEWRNPRSDLTGVGRPIEVNDVTGAFWFFRPSNVELVVKVLDGRPVNGRFWVLYGSLTDVAFTLRVRHAETLDAVTFENAPFEMSSGADTSSLVPPECNCPLAPPQPVCGFDGMTYDDACLARCLGWVGVAHPGPCENDEGGS